jgi:hypothetical protein
VREKLWHVIFDPLVSNHSGITTYTAIPPNGMFGAYPRYHR